MTMFGHFSTVLIYNVHIGEDINSHGPCDPGYMQSITLHEGQDYLKTLMVRWTNPITLVQFVTNMHGPVEFGFQQQLQKYSS